jgi:transcriptional regulator with XRE-family HTH domain
LSTHNERLGDRVHFGGTFVVLPGQKIKQIRQERGYSLRALAKRADVSVAYLSKLERNESSPTVGLLTRLAEALSVSVEDLVDSTPPAEEAAALPASLVEFITKFQGEIPELSDPEWQRTLGQVRLRGKYPENDMEWMAIFLSMRSALGSD